ncbi:MAG: hypothetical protein WCZ86_00850 [Desulfurivibrionaceae bacterium]|jgi:hypothetical protein
MLQKARILFVFAIISIFLFGCWVPEKFQAKVAVNKDGSYTFVYDGILTFAAVLMAGQGELSARDEADLKKEAVKIAKEPGFKKVDYLGKGRYKVLVEKIGKPGEPYYFLSRESQILSILPQKDGTVSVSAIRPDKKAIQELSSIGVKIDGTLSVSVASEAKVLKHNAQSQPKLFGLLGDYKWQIKSPDENPVIVVQPVPPVKR